MFHSRKSIRKNLYLSRSKVAAATATAVLTVATFLSSSGASPSLDPSFAGTAHPDVHRHPPFGWSEARTYGEEMRSSLLSSRGGDSSLHGLVPHSKPAPGAPPLRFAHGTTTLSFTFEGGIVAAVDSRASIGNFVGSKTTQKVLPVSRHILGTMAGGAADCSFWIRRLRSEAKLHELTENRPITVARASRILSDALYANRHLQLSVGTMIMGYDASTGRSSIYYVDNTGQRIKGDMFAVGSGSTFALGILDTERRDDMTEEEAIELGIRAIRHATFRDAYSGGYIGVYVITKDGWRKVFSEDLALSAEHMQEEEEEKAREDNGCT